MYQGITESCVFYDTETTGKNENNDDHIIQIAYTYKDLRECRLYGSPKKIGLGAMATHHITQDMIEGKPVFRSSEQRQACKRLNNAGKIFVAHNARFDNQMMKQAGIDIVHSICTMKLARHVLYEDETCEEFSLQYLRYFFGLKFESEINPHDAMSDTVVLVKLFERLFDMLCRQELDEFDEGSLEKMLERCEEISNSPTLIRIMPFGKHKGKTFDEIESEDPQYVGRFLRQDAIDEDVAYSMRTARKKAGAATESANSELPF